MRPTCATDFADAETTKKQNGIANVGLTKAHGMHIASNAIPTILQSATTNVFPLVDVEQTAQPTIGMITLFPIASTP